MPNKIILLAFLLALYHVIDANSYHYPSHRPNTYNSNANDEKQDHTECPFDVEISCDRSSKYSEFDGSCNNLDFTNIGKTSTPLKRLLPAAYEDAKEYPRSLNEQSEPLPTPRSLSLALSKDNNEFNFWTHIFSVFGQFVTHDMSDVVRSPVTCFCGSTNPECLNIPLEEDDPLRRTCLPFVRSLPSVDFFCRSKQRQQLNWATHFLDLSQVYGLSLEESRELRSYIGGLMITTDGIVEDRPYLPKTKEICSASHRNSSYYRKREDPQRKCFESGDHRTTENLGLSSIHTIFVREHNRIAGALAEVNQHWSDNRLFYETRRIMIAVYQHIIYDQYVASIIGKKDTQKFELFPVKYSKYYYGYDPSVDPSIYNEFTTAAMRWGHSTITNQFARHASDNSLIDSSLNFTNINFNVDPAYTVGGLDSILIGMVVSNGSDFDMSIAHDLQNNLIADLGTRPIDLAAFNLNRGRDHGLQPYVKYLEYCTGIVAKSFDDLSPVIKPEELAQLMSAYKNVEDIDLWMGGLAEHDNDSDDGGPNDEDVLTGPTFTCILGKQFRDLKRGDRFYYENAPDYRKGTEHTAFTLNQLKEIKKMTLSRVLCNTVDIESIQRNVFFIAGDPVIPDNDRKACPNHPQMNLYHWKEKSDHGHYD